MKNFAFFRLFARAAAFLCVLQPFAERAATVSWVGGSGDWETATNWSAGQLPGPTDDVVIGSGPSITVTHSIGADTVHSVTSQQQIQLSGGTLTVLDGFQMNNTFILSGGTLAQANVTLGAGDSMIAGANSPTLNGVTLEGTLDVGNAVANTSLFVANGLTLNGTMLVGNPTNQNWGRVYFVGSQSLVGLGTVVFGNESGTCNGSVVNALDVELGSTALTIGQGITVRGQNGTIGYNACIGGSQSISVTNLGAISCDVAGGAIYLVAYPFVNENLAQATNGGALYLPGNWVNNSNMAAASSPLYLTGSGINNATLAVSGSAIAFGNCSNNGAIFASNSWVLNGGTIAGGKIALTNGASVVAQNGPTLNGVTVEGLLDVGNTAANTSLFVTNGLTLNGTMLVGNPSNQNWGRVYFVGSQNLAGLGTVVFGNESGQCNGSVVNALDVELGSTALTIGQGITIRGQNGTIGYNACIGGSQSVSVTNLGAISSDTPGSTIYVEAQPLINQGVMGSTNGGTLVIGGSCVNSGSLGGSGGTVILSGNFENLAGTQTDTDATIISGTFSNGIGQTLVFEAASTITGSLINQGGQVVVSGSSQLALNGGTIQGGTVIATNGALLAVNGSGTLNGATVDGLLDVGNAVANASLFVTNGLTLNGTMLVGNPSNQDWGRVYFVGNQTLAGLGTVAFGNESGQCNGSVVNALDVELGGTALTIGQGITIRGQNGTIGYNACIGGSQSVSVTNLGAISCDVAGGAIYLVAYPFVNENVAQATNGGALYLPGNWVNNSNMTAASSPLYLTGSGINNATLAVSGSAIAFGNCSNNGAIFASNSWALNGGTIVGGTIALTNGASVVALNGPTLNGVTVDGLLDVGNAVGNTSLNVTNGLTLNGTMLVGNPTNQSWGRVYFVGSQSLAGNGAVVFGNSPNCSGAPVNALDMPDAGTTLTVGPKILIHGANGTIGYNPCLGGPLNIGVINQGIISCDIGGGLIYLDDAPFLNQGLAQATNGGTLNLAGVWSNTGTLAASGATVNLSGNWSSVGAINETNGTVTLNGTFSLPEPAVINGLGGEVLVSGLFNNVSNTLPVNGIGISCVLSGATIHGGTIAATNGAQFFVAGSETMEGVVLNGTLDVGATYASSVLTVVNGLTLNGTLLVGNPTNRQPGYVNFQGSQSLGGNGTVVFGNSANCNGTPGNALYLGLSDSVLTIGPGILIHGANGTIGYSPCENSPGNVSVVNLGTISCDVSDGFFYLDCQPFVNENIAQAVNGGSLYLTGSWNSPGAINETNSVVTLQGSFALPSPGSINGSNGEVAFGGTLNNASNTIPLNGTNVSWVLSGSLIQGGTLVATNGSPLLVDGSQTLEGVTLDGTLDVGNTYGSSVLTVVNGLTLNGTLLVGNPANRQPGYVNFLGSQGLGGNGTVLFGNSANCNGTPGNALYMGLGDTVLTIGPGILIHGDNGTIGYSPCQSSPGNVSVVNLGTISCDVDGGFFYLDCQPFVNENIAQAVNGGSLYLTGSWSSPGMINETNSVVTLQGSFALPSPGSINGSGGEVAFGGTLNNASNTVPLNGTNISWVLSGSLIQGGTLVATNGAPLVVDGSQTLEGVTVEGTLDVGNTYSSSVLTVVNGLTLNGTLLVGNPANRQPGYVNFQGSQSLGGNGSVVFGDSANCNGTPANALYLSLGDTVLTIGPGILIHGDNGTIGYSPCQSSPGNVSVINLGTISCDVNDGFFYLDCQPFVNESTAQAINGGSLYLTGSWNSPGTINETNSVVTLQGSFALPSPGSINASNGEVAFGGTLNNASNTIPLNGTNVSWVLSGSLIQGGTLVATNGSPLLVDGSQTLEGVTLDGTLDVGATYASSVLTVVNGLTLNGTMLVGNPANRQPGYVNFLGSQSLGGNGTVLFGNSANCNGTPGNALYLGLGDTVLTIGPGILIHGDNGTIGYSPCENSPVNVSVINLGTISCDVNGGFFYLACQPFVNQNVAQALNGGSLYLAGTWSSPGLINETNSSVTLNGTFALPNSGGINGLGGGISLIGTLNNAGNTIPLNGANVSWVLSGSVIQGGTLVATNGSPLLVDGSETLEGVTVNGTLDVGNTYGSSMLTVIDGLTLNGTLLVGNPVNQQPGYVNFQGSQSLGGNGTVVFGNSAHCNGTPANALYLGVSDTTLTIGPEILIHGANGSVGYSPCENGPGSVGVVNFGTISCDVLNGNIICGGQAFTDYGSLEAYAGATVTWPGDVELNGQQILVSQAGCLIQIGGNLLGGTENADQYSPQGTTEFIGGPHLLEAMSQDRGATANGYLDNFAYGSLQIDSGAQVTLVDNSTNSAGPLPECVYANVASVSSGATLNLNGLHLYARLSQIAGTVSNGTVIQIPNAGGPLALDTPIGGSLAGAGSLDNWTFFGWAGERVTVIVNTGGGGDVSPLVNYAQVQLIGPMSNLLTQASNSVAQQTVGIFDVALPVDGTYTVTVSAPSTAPASVGNYLVTVWDSTPTIAPLVINQQANGLIATPYGVNIWNFSAMANQQISFELLNASAPGVAFGLTGPNGWTGFSNTTASSGFITLPYSGSYTVTAFGTDEQYGINYAFKLDQTAETNLSLEAPFTGQLVASGQAQLVAVNVTNSNPMLISLSLGAAGNQVQLYAKLGSPPTPSDYDFSYQGVASQTEDLLIPSGSEGTWYILIYGYYLAQPVSYSVEVIQNSLILESFAPSSAGTSLNTVISIVGAGFNSNTLVQLTSTNGTNATAQSINIVSPTEITAFFGSNTIPAGTYTVCVSSPSTTQCLTNLLTVVLGGLPDFHASVIAPSLVGYHIPSTLYIDYANTGTAAMPAPLLTLTGVQDGLHHAIMTLNSAVAANNPGGFYGPTSEPAGYSSSVQILASGSVPGLLQPGESYQIPVFYAGWMQPWDFSYPAITFELGTYTADNTSAIDWASYGTNFQPAGISRTEWTNLLSGMETYFGATWGDYVNALDQLVGLTSPVNGPAYDATQLFNIAFQQISGTGVSSLSGRVINAATQQPLAGVTLTDTGANLTSVTTVTTDENGAFALSQLYAGVQNLSLVGYLITSGAQFTIPTNADLFGATVDATLAGQITGQVTAATTGSALPNVQVFCVGLNTSNNFLVTTAANGDYEFPTLPADTYTVIFSANGFAGVTTSNVVVVLGEIQSNVNARLLAGATITGTATQSNGTPLSGALVFMQAETNTIGFTISTASNGSYEIANLPADNYTIMCSFSGFISQTISDVTVSVGTTSSNNDFSLAPGGSIVGNLVDASDGSAITNAVLVLTNSAGDQFYANSGINGIFTFAALPTGAYSLQCNPTNALPVQITLSLTTGESITNVLIEVESGGAISGTVTNTATGMPMADVPVVAIAPGGDAMETQTDALGNYSFTLLSATGIYEVYILDAPDSDVVNVEVQELDGGSAIADLGFSPTATIVGILKDAEGNPIHGSVLLYEEGQLITSSQTDANDQYGFLILKPGQFQLQGIADSATFAPIDVEVNPGDDLTNAIPSGTSTLSLGVSSPAGAVVGATVILFQYTDIGLVYDTATTVGASNNVIFNEIVPGNYRLMVMTTNDNGVVQDFSVTNSTNSLNATLAQTFNVNGVISDNGGQPLNGALVFLTEGTSNLSYSAQSQSNGTYAVSSVPSGIYTVTVISDGCKALVQPNIAIGNDLTLNESLAPSVAQVTGNVIDDSGNPIQIATINVFDGSDNLIASGETTTNGSFILSTAYGTNLSMVIAGFGGMPVTNAIPILQNGTTNIGSLVVSVVAIAGTPASGGTNKPLVALASVENGLPPEALDLQGESPPDGSPYIDNPEYADDFWTYSDLNNILTQAQYLNNGNLTAPKPCSDPEVDSENQLLWRAYQQALNKVFSDRQVLRQELNQVASSLGDIAFDLDRLNDDEDQIDTDAENAIFSALIVEATSLSVTAAGGSAMVVGIAATTVGFLTDLVFGGLKRSSVLNARDMLEGIFQMNGWKSALAASKKYARLAQWTSALLDLSPACADWLGDNALLNSAFTTEEQYAQDAQMASAKLQQDWNNMMTLGLVTQYVPCPGSGQTPLAPPLLFCISCDLSSSASAGSHDPNAKIGPAGFGAAGWIVGDTAFPYTIDFENSSNATAPAQIVDVSDPLSTNFDWTTFELAAIGFGSNNIPVPPNSQYFATNVVTVNGGMTIIVEIQAGINLSTGEVFADFYTVDAATELAPPINIGFLPPEDGTGRGDGYVTYFIQPKAGLTEGTQITNVAYVQFDENPIIATDQENDNDPSAGIDTTKLNLVTIDAIPPTSSVEPLPSISTNANFTICWSGTNVGAAIVSYDIYASTNNGPWGDWLEETTNLCSQFSGAAGNSYAFYSIAHDGAGLIQTNSGAAQASTTVAAAPPFTIGLSAQRAILAWPTNFASYVLQTTTNLAGPAHWSAVTNAVSVVGSSNTIALPITNTSQFFRLQSQP